MRKPGFDWVKAKDKTTLNSVPIVKFLEHKGYTGASYVVRSCQGGGICGFDAFGIAAN